MARLRRTLQYMYTGDITGIYMKLITCTDRGDVKQAVVPSGTTQQLLDVALLDDEEIPERLAELLSGGVCAGIIVNTVRRVQD